MTGASFRLPFAMSATLGSYLLTVDLSLPFFLTTLLYALGTTAFWLFFREYDARRAKEGAAARAADVARPK